MGQVSDYGQNKSAGDLSNNSKSVHKKYVSQHMTQIITDLIKLKMSIRFCGLRFSGLLSPEDGSIIQSRNA